MAAASTLLSEVLPAALGQPLDQFLAAMEEAAAAAEAGGAEVAAEAAELRCEGCEGGVVLCAAATSGFAIC